MSHVKTLLVVVLLLSYGAVGARQPAVRGRLPLPVPVKAIGDALGLPAPHASTLLLDITRLIYATDKIDEPRVRAMRMSLGNVLSTRGSQAADTVPLPLDPSIWRDTLLQQQVPDQAMVAAIAGDRRGSLLYHGLSALDDETLAWLGPDRETLLRLRNHAGTFAVFGRSLHVRAGRVVVPGGDAAEPLWESIVGASVSKPSAFVQHLFNDDRAAFFYDSMSHLDTGRQHFALGLHLPESPRKDRFIALFEVFQDTSPEWRPDVSPFWRPLLDPGLVLSTIALTDGSLPAGPMGRRLWDRVFRGDETIDASFSTIDPRDVAAGDESTPSDAAGIAGRVSRPAYTIGRRRLDTILFAQRVFRGRRADEPGVATALRGFVVFPALMLTLERIGVTDPAALAGAAERANALDGVRAEATRRTAMLQFQAALGIVERIQRTGLLDAAATGLLATSLVRVEASPERGYEGRLVEWLRTVLVPALPAPPAGTAPLEDAILSAMAGVRGDTASQPTIEWEGARYRVDAASAELARLRRVRAEQGGPSLDAALGPEQAADAGGQVLSSILYAAYLGDPAGPGVTAGNAALRHDLGVTIVTPGARSGAPWRLPREDFSGRAGWRVRGSLLGLDTALGRLAMRRLDPTSMPEEPKLAPHQRVALSMTGALFNPFAMTDAARDEIAATLGRGRARVAALTPDDAAIDRVAREAGLSEWRRMALAWTIANDREALLQQFSLLEIFWLGAPRGSALRALDAWGAAAQPLTGCLCLEMPRPQPWEDFAGRMSSGVIATRAADVALRVADAFATLHLPATLAPGVLAFALQDVTEHARPGYPEDWNEFGRAARELPLDRITDYVAALASNGPLVPQEDKH